MTVCGSYLWSLRGVDMMGERKGVWRMNGMSKLEGDGAEDSLP